MEKIKTVFILTNTKYLDEMSMKSNKIIKIQSEFWLNVVEYYHLHFYKILTHCCWNVLIWSFNYQIWLFLKSTMDAMESGKLLFIWCIEQVSKVKWPQKCYFSIEKFSCRSWLVFWRNWMFISRSWKKNPLNFEIEKMQTIIRSSTEYEFYSICIILCLGNNFWKTFRNIGQILEGGLNGFGGFDEFSARRAFSLRRKWSCSTCRCVPRRCTFDVDDRTTVCRFVIMWLMAYMKIDIKKIKFIELNTTTSSVK